jgi:hypothetical protein
VDKFGHPWRLAAIALSLAVFAAILYRAATQSITHDEGVMFEWYLSGSWGDLLAFEHGNHHVLDELLCKLSVSLFGPSELALRLPAALGCLIYLYSTLRLSVLFFGEGPLLLLSVALLDLNPFVQDYFSCARGYSLALGLFFFAMYSACEYLAGRAEATPRTRRILQRAGIALGLAIGSNPIMLFPGTALVLVILGITLYDSFLRARNAPKVAASRKERRKTRKDQPETKPGWAWEQSAVHFLLPAVAIAGFLSILPKKLMDPEPGYLGPPSLPAIFEPLVRHSLLHSPSGFKGLLSSLPVEPVIIAATVALAASLALVTALALLIAARTRAEFASLETPDRLILLLGAMLPLALVLIVVSRYGFGQAYPELRTAMYWLPLLTLACLVIIQRLWRLPGAPRAAAWILSAVSIAVALQYLTQFNTRYIAEWQYCAAVKDMMRIVRAEHSASTPTPVRIGANWKLEPVINFYRVAWGLSWVEPVDRASPDGDFDYFLLIEGDRDLVERRHLQVLLRDPLSESVLAKRTAL